MSILASWFGAPRRLGQRFYDCVLVLYKMGIAKNLRNRLSEY